MARTSDAKIDEALDLLNEAAKEKKEDIGSILTERYEDLRRYLTTRGGSETFGKRMGDRIGETASAARDMMQKQAKRAADSVDQEAHQRPWAFIGGAAVATLIVGYFLGHRG